MDRSGFDPAEIAAGEELLTRFAHQFGPKELRRLAEKVVEAKNVSGSSLSPEKPVAVPMPGSSTPVIFLPCRLWTLTSDFASAR